MRTAAKRVDKRLDQAKANIMRWRDGGPVLFAQEALLSSDKWKLSASRYTRSEKAVALDAKRFRVGLAIIAGRIRREAGNYTLLKNLVGTGEVRRQFDL